MSVLATTTRAEDLPESFVGRSILGVDGSAAAAALAFAAGFARDAGGGAAGAEDVGAASASATEAGIGVPSGRSEMVRTGFGSGKDGAIAGAGGGDMTTTGVSTVPRTAEELDESDGAAGAADGGGAVWACRSTGCSSVLTTVTRLTCVLSLSREAPTSFGVETVASLGGCTLVGPCAAAMNGGAFGIPGSLPLSAKTAPIIATPAMARVETVQSQRRDRRGRCDAGSSRMSAYSSGDVAGSFSSNAASVSGSGAIASS